MHPKMYRVTAPVVNWRMCIPILMRQNADFILFKAASILLDTSGKSSKRSVMPMSTKHLPAFMARFDVLTKKRLNRETDENAMTQNDEVAKTTAPYT